MFVCVSVAYIGPKSRTERPRKTKIGTEVAHITRDSDITFKVNGQLAGGGHIEVASRTAYYTIYYCCPRVFVVLALTQPKKVTRWGDRSTTAGKLQLDHES